ncbi:MAG: MgtC/SapB family protein [Proteobacteria bacterium]|nr:MgtC/SapB family protein [Pseudomonadota bacterium]
MPDIDPLLVSLAVALGIGLLIGADRERRKGEGPSRAAAGLRTFMLASLGGALAFIVGGELLLAVATLGVALLAGVSYWRTRDDDPGITTEAALILTTLIGGLAVRHPALAAGLGTLIAGLLHARSPLHDFVRSVLSEQDVRDALIFAGATLIVLPLLPDRPIGPFGGLNLHALWVIVILVMGVSAIGYVMIRIAGARFGLPLAGLASGFISSIATIGAMGERAAKAPHMLKSAAAGAVLSTVATIVQMAVVLAATSLAVLQALYLPLILAGIVAVLYGLLFTVRALNEKAGVEYRPDRAFSLSSAITFGAVLATINFSLTAFQHWFGSTGTLVAAAVSGFADTHASAVSVASLVAANQMTTADAVVPILMALSTNTVTKLLFAMAKGSWRFAAAVIPGLILVILAAWAGTLLG